MRRKNVLLVTLFDNNNIGNRLQNYALYHILESFNVNVVTLDNHYTTQPSFKYVIKMQIKRILGKCGNLKFYNEYNLFCITNKKRKANKAFNKRNIKNVKSVRNSDVFEQDWSDFDIAIAGSDQIWHKWRNDVYELPFYYLEFIPKEKRFAYAASFGFENIPKKDLDQHKVGLTEMKQISCRENTGCNIVKDITGKDVPKVLDPTLLLSPKEWEKIAEQASVKVKRQNKYAFVYFLGNITEEYKNHMDKIVKSLKITEIIDFSDNKMRSITKLGPSEFLYLIANADYIFTDSFHCIVFSTLFNKEFIAFKRIQPGFEKMFSRIEEFLSSKGMLNHIYGGTQIEETNDFDELLKFSMNYLKGILEANNEDRAN